MSDARSTPAARAHGLLTAAALAAIALVLVLEGYDMLALLPVLPGLLALLFYSVAGPPLVLFLLTFLLVAGSRWHGFRPPGAELSDYILAAACLVYVAAHYRLLSLVKQAVPGDARREKRPARRRLRGRWMLPAKDATRTPGRVPAREPFALVGQGALFAAAGFLLSVRLQLETAPPDLHLKDQAWRVLLVAWAVLLTLMAGSAAFAGLRWLRAGGDEGRVYLQDQLWAATRGEQRRIDAWVTRERLRREAK